MLDSDKMNILYPLKELHLSGIKYVLIRHPKFNEIKGDIDILVANIGEIDAIVKELGYSLYSTSSYSAKYLRFDSDLNNWIHLDVQSSLKFGEYIMPIKYCDTLLKSRIQVGDIFVLPQFHEGIITLFHMTMNKTSFDSSYVERVLAIDYNKNEHFLNHYSFLPFNLREFIVHSQRLLKLESQSFKLLRSYACTSFGVKSSVRNSIFSRLFSRLRSLSKVPKGVVLLGPDGSGKSTIISSFEPLLWPKTKAQYMGPSDKDSMNPSLYRLLLVLDKIRSRYSKGSILGVLARLLWIAFCYIDYWFRLLSNIWFIGSRGFVMYDRYPLDMYVRTPKWFNELIFIKLFPKPRLVFLCLGDPVQIHNRKLELKSSCEVARVIELYKAKLTGYGIPYVEINTTQNCLEDNIKDIIDRLILEGFYLD